MSDCIKSVLNDGIEIITISRPEKRNAFNQEIREGLARALERAVSDSSCKGIVLTGEGPHFSVGGDADAFESMSATDLHALLAAAHRCVRSIRQTSKPVVAAVEGYAAGGAAGLILACDAVVAAHNAKIAFPFLRLGLVPDWGCVHFLREKVGDGAARKLLLRPTTLSGEEALRAGVADELSDPGLALSTALDLVRIYVGFPGEAWGRTKTMLNTSSMELETSLSQEREHQAACFLAPEFRQALAGFLDKKASRK
ncbi:enoyl-CoA hydratase/isomerase family protein [Eoetvoesiella caeni]